MNRNLIQKLIFITSSIALVCCSLFFVVQLVQLNVLPPKYLFFIITAFTLIDALILLIQHLYSKKLVLNIILVILSLAISLSLAFGSYYLLKTNSMLSNITNISEGDNKVSVIVKQSSSMKELKDIKGKKVGTLRHMGTSGTVACLEALQNNDISIERVNYDNISNLMKAFYSSETEAIILNEAYRSNVLDMDAYKNFNSNTRILYQTGYELKDKNKVNAVDDVTQHSFNVLITGSDSRNGIQENARSDVNMIVTVNPISNTVLLTSIPRDYYVNMVCDAEDGCANGELDKITHTGVFGVNVTKKTIEELFGIEINYTVKVSFETVTRIVDALGGVDVYVEPGYAVSTKTFTVTEGKNHLNGEQALAYARERFSYEEGDRQRTKNQQQVVMGIIDKMSSPHVIANYADLMDALGGTFQTNMSAEEIQSIVQFQMDKMPSWKIEQYMVDGSGARLMCASLGQEAYVMVPDQQTVKVAKEKISAVMDGESSDSVDVEE